MQVACLFALSCWRCALTPDAAPLLHLQRLDASMQREKAGFKAMVEAINFGYIDVIPLGNELGSNVMAFSPAVVEVCV